MEVRVLSELARQIFGLPIPDEGTLFDAALAFHIAAGITCVITGALAATAPKRPGRHTLSGRIFFWSLAVVFASSTTMAALRFAQDWHLLVIGTVAFGAGGLGYLARRRRRPRWLRIHIPAMGGAYLALFTGFYVDNGPHLPVWDRLPGLAYWTLPSLVGIPLILRALARRRLLRVRPAPRGRPGSGVRRGRPG
jgi:peptidoglycan/LPS O-acetylase OafA/YrhL